MADVNHNASFRFPDRSVTIWEHCRHNATTTIPLIRLAGKWIEQAGFEPAHRIRIEVSLGRMIITPIEESDLDSAIHGIPVLNRQTGLRRRVKS